jgi:hypothetical protein
MGALIFIGVLVGLFIIWFIADNMVAICTRWQYSLVLLLTGGRYYTIGAIITGRKYERGETFNMRRNPDGTVTMIRQDGTIAHDRMIPVVRPEAMRTIYRGDGTSYLANPDGSFYAERQSPGWQPTRGQVAGAGVLGLAAGVAFERHHHHRVEERQGQQAQFAATMDQIMHPQHPQAVQAPYQRWQAPALPGGQHPCPTCYSPTLNVHHCTSCINQGQGL